MSPFSRLIRHHPVSAQANQQTSFASGLLPHPWRGGNASGGLLERGGGSARSVSMCGTRGVNCTICKIYVPFLALFDTTPSPHRRINRPRSLLAFVHIHGEAETPTEGFWSAVVGRHGPFLCAEQGVSIHMQNVPFLETHSTSPRLRTGDSTDLVRFWPSPTSMARRKRQRRASGERWWVGTVRFYVRNKRGEYPYAICPLSRDSFDTTPSPHRRINRPRSLLAFAHIHGEAETPAEGFWSAVVGRHGPFLCAEQEG
jgi:hypothetical protein